MKKGLLLMLTAIFSITASHARATKKSNSADTTMYYNDDTRALVALVTDAAALVGTKGEAAFADFSQPGLRWRQGETYIFVLSPAGDMLVHPDPELQGRNQSGLQDINGKLIIRGLVQAATALPGKPEGWYHYEWPVPGGLLPRWKSSYVRFVKAPSGKGYIVGSGMYNDRMETGFVVSAVKNAVGLIEKEGEAAFKVFHDRTSPFMAKDAYIFIIDTGGVELVNPAFPSLEGRNVLDLKDTRGKLLVREMFKVVNAGGGGWVEYMWPKPGESASTVKSTYVSKARLGNTWVLVGCGVYLADAPKAVPKIKKMTAARLKTLVHDAASIFEKEGEKAYPEFRKKNTKWFHDDVYFFVWTMDGVRVFHAANPSGEGMNVSNSKDVLGRPWGRMFIDVAASAGGEGWVHYMYPEPGDIFPTWKSSFLKRVTFPSGRQYIIGCGIYNMDMDKMFIEDVVNSAVELIERKGEEAFGTIRDKTGPFVFMDTYVFVDNTDGDELVNAGQPALEGKNLMGFRDLHGKAVVRDQIDLILQKGSGWLKCYWYQPGNNTPALKQTFVRKAVYDGHTYIVGSGLYLKDK